MGCNIFLLYCCWRFEAMQNDPKIMINLEKINSIQEKYLGVETVQNTLAALHDKEAEMERIDIELHDVLNMTCKVVKEYKKVVLEYEKAVKNYSGNDSELKAIKDIEAKLDNKEIEYTSLINKCDKLKESYISLLNDYTNLVNLIYGYD